MLFRSMKPGMRLGCLNHALLSAEAIIKDGLRLAGWVANSIDPQMLAFEDNVATLSHILRAPCLGVLPHQTIANIEQLANCLNLEMLLAKPV